ncbi:hypothetical protein [Gephyromycinifex aptenodytis]|uniref:hypothetical protein n=1 Tax=Gephyromycinifex aptenodytis TaxID=2716227 RepID=UPI001447AE00|nr:hypothetical protein [Gephyromycinifex aptenodytis]
MQWASVRSGTHSGDSTRSWRALAGLALAWALSVAVAYVGFPLGDATHAAHLWSVLVASWWASPVVSWPVIGVLAWSAPSSGAWWRESRWAFAGLLALTLLFCGLVAGVVTTLASIVAGQVAAVAVEGIVGVIMWGVWTGLPVWVILAGLAVAPAGVRHVR